MKLLLVIDAHLYRTPDGKVWSKTIYDYEFCKRYLEVFNEVRVVSRVMKVEEINQDSYLRVDGSSVEVFDMPFFRGPKEYIGNIKRISKLLSSAIVDCDCAIFRIPSSLSFILYKEFRKTGKPFAVEVVADPWDSLSPKVTKGFMGVIARFNWTYYQKKMCREANGSSYVTSNYLQSRYPSHIRKFGNTKNFFESSYSTISLETDFYSEPKMFLNKKELKIVHTANNINNFVKGHDTLIKALSIVKKKGYNVKVIFIGDGDKRVYFEELADSLNIKSSIHFTGMLSSKNRIREILIDSDMFIFPTRAEGLPRALIEAMAVGLPCISTPVSGIPELLSSDYLVDPEDVEGFANSIINFINNPALMEKVSQSNITKAKEYESNILQKKRVEFYKNLKSICNTPIKGY
ncbi:glycosyltransferase involved in cell wall biosynthesis [Bacillus mesophilus]|uniref:Glycosyltransferase family 4 protein n=1 Tax=Bacillus mesophilus TaxID=1808955 RepID=A0A6M0Q7Q4_9BACI|nr:glycosyltransferase involved in cell wall biosynthesis [Bacillus mesophilus]NEY72381.1 glycosyltransferase family 4 protein [Bacillus mesophilus]